jgi:hypothetical protein
MSKDGCQAKVGALKVLECGCAAAKVTPAGLRLCERHARDLARITKNLDLRDLGHSLKETTQARDGAGR